MNTFNKVLTASQHRHSFIYLDWDGNSYFEGWTFIMRFNRET